MVMGLSNILMELSFLGHGKTIKKMVLEKSLLMNLSSIWVNGGIRKYVVKLSILIPRLINKLNCE